MRKQKDKQPGKPSERRGAREHGPRVAAGGCQAQVSSPERPAARQTDAGPTKEPSGRREASAGFLRSRGAEENAYWEIRSAPSKTPVPRGRTVGSGWAGLWLASGSLLGCWAGRHVWR